MFFTVTIIVFACVATRYGHPHDRCMLLGTLANKDNSFTRGTQMRIGELVSAASITTAGTSFVVGDKYLIGNIYHRLLFLFFLLHSQHL